MVGIECNSATLMTFQEGPHKKLYFQEKSFFFKFCKQGGKPAYSRYSQVSLLTLCYHWKTLNNKFLYVCQTDYLYLLYFTCFLSI